MSAPRRLLVLAPFPPRLDADHGGARAVAHLVTGLSERHDVGLLCFRAPGEPPVGPEVCRRCALVEEVPRRTDGGPLGRRALRAARLLTGLAAGTPSWAGAFADPAFAARLRHVQGAWSPDVVQAEFHVMGPYLRGVSGPPTVLVEHEPGVGAAVDRLRTAPLHAKAWYRLELAAWRRFEPRVLRSAGAVVAFTERDRRALRALAPDAHIETIPLAVPLPGRPSDAPSDSTGSGILFVGNFDHPPNRDAAARLVGTILPAVRERCPGAHLTLVGHQPGERIARAAGVTVTGRVPDVGPYLGAATVVVAPVFTGGGMRVKVIEALAAGKAVVASPLAVEGLGVVDGEHVVLAPDEEAFADRVVGLLLDGPGRRALGARARAWAERHVSVSRMVGDYEALYERLLSRTPPPTP